MPEHEMINDLEKLDLSTLQAKLVSARNVIEAAPRDPKLESEVAAALREEIKRIQDFAEANPDTEFAKANRHLLLGGGRPLAARSDAAIAATASEETWKCVGSVNMSSFVWWALGGTVMFAPPLGFMFGAKGGPDWALSTFASGIAGAFVVDPQIIRDKEMHPEGSGVGTVYKGKCKFQLGQLGAGAGGVRISFYSLQGTYWGMLGGVSGGLGGASLSGECDLVWS